MKEKHGFFSSPKPAVHVLMPVYNAKPYIQQAIDSVLSQEYPNIKLLIFDDGSTDGTREIIEQNQEAHPEVVLLKGTPTNTGVANARKNLFLWSKELNLNAYIFSLDADDKYTDKYFIRDVITKMLNTHADICLFNYAVQFEDETARANAEILLKEKSQVTEILDRICKQPKQKISPVDFPDLLKFSSLGCIKCYGPTIRLPDADNFPFDDFVYMAALLKANTITALPSQQQAYHYLRHSTSICGNRKSENFETHIPSQLHLFFLNVCMDSNKSSDNLLKVRMAQDFVSNKLASYHELLKNLIAKKSFADINETTLKRFEKARDSLQLYMTAIVAHIREQNEAKSLHHYSYDGRGLRA